MLEYQWKNAKENGGFKGMEKATIYTSSWFTKLPPAHARISIARSAPRGQSGFQIYRQLAPGKWFNSVSPMEYRRRYYDEILGRLNPDQVVSELVAMSEGRIPTLLCWEKPEPGPDWCHRGWVSSWLYESLGLEVFEWGQERHGCGPGHPKIPSEFRIRKPLPVPDRSAEILPHVGKLFKSGKVAFQVKGVSPDFPDQAVVTDGKRDITITVETLLAKLAS